MQFGFRTILFVMLLMALPLASYFYMFKPRDEEMRRALEEVRDKQETLAQLERASADSKDLPQQIEKLKKAITFFESKLPEEKEMDKVLHQIWQQAEKNGLNVKSVRNMTVVNQPAYSEQPIRMVIVGPTTGFHKFLKSVEQMARSTRIGEMSMNDDKGEGIITADMVMTIFFERSESKPST